MTKRGIALLWGYTIVYKWSWLIGITFILMAASLSLVQPLMLGVAIDNLQNKNADHSLIGAIIIIMIGLAMVEGIFRFSYRYTTVRTSRKIEYDIRATLFRLIQAQDQAYFHNIHTGDLMSRATNDLNQVRNFLGMGVNNFCQTLFSFTLAIFLMFQLNVGLTLIVLIVLPLASITFFLTGQAMQNRYEKVQAKFGEISTHAQENFSGIRVVKAYAQEELEVKKFATQNQAYIKENLAYTQLSGLLWPLMFLILGLATSLVLWIGGGLVINKELTLGQLVQFLSYIALLSWPMIAFGWVVNLFQQGVASMKRIAEVLTSKPIVTPPIEPITLTQMHGKVEYKHVSLRYETQVVLDDVSFEVPAGTSCAIVGLTGEGKTTLVNMLSRVRDADKGTVLIDDVDVRQFDLAWLRRQLGYVPQDTFLFSLPLGENIAFGITDYTDSQIDRAAQTARLSKDLEQIPGGLAAVLGERGVTLSGGQKQRTAIARAVMRNPAILILDDALSSIDTQTQAEILANLTTVMQDRTTFIISQRISTVKNCDQILVLNNGKISEQGTHHSLLADNGLYATMYQRELLTQELELEQAS